MNFARVCALSLSLLAAASTANVALANDVAAAQALFDKGKKQLAAGNTKAACESFEESMRLDPGVGTKYQLGRCYETLGRSASAWTAFLDAASLAQAAGQKDRAAAARKKADALESKLSKLTVEASKPVDGLTVKVGDTTMRGAALGTAIPFDPGTHDVTAEAPGFEAWKGSVTVPSDAAPVSLSIPALKALPAAEPKPLEKGASSAEPVMVSTGPQPLFWVGLGSAIMGAVAITGGAVWIDNEAIYYDSFEDNPAVVPGATIISAGIVAVGVGTLFMVLFVDGEEPASNTGVHITPMLSPSNMGLRVDF